MECIVKYGKKIFVYIDILVEVNILVMCEKCES